LNLGSGEAYTTTDANGNYTFENLPAGSYIIREENRAGWTQIAPADTTIPAAVWSNSQWNVTLEDVDDPDNPDGPDSHRNVKNVDFGNQSSGSVELPLFAGDFDRSGVVDAGDYIMWRKLKGSSVSAPFAGPDANGNGVVDDGDIASWHSTFGSGSSGSGSQSLLVANGASLSAESSDGAMASNDANGHASVTPSIVSTSAHSGSSLRAKTALASDSSRADTALLAWLHASLKRRSVDIGGGSALSGSEAESDDSYCDSVDSIFEEFGAGAI
jgi:hypothetical protein